MTKTTGNFTDFLDFSRSTGGTSLRRIALGEEELTTTTVSFDGTQADYATIVLGFVPTAGTLYQVVVDATAGTSGKIQINTSGDDTGYVVAGTKKVISLDNMHLTTAASAQAQSGGGSNKYVGSATFSVKEVTLDAPSGDLVLFNHPDDIPRVEYDADGNVKGLLIEEARTNLVTDSVGASSDDLSQSISQTSGQTNELTGLSDAFLVTVTGTGTAYTGQSASVTSGTSYTASRFIKSGTTNFAQLSMGSSGFGSDVYANFNLSDGTVAAEFNCNASIVSMGNGWYRCSISAEATATTSATSPNYLTPISSGSSIIRTSANGNAVYQFGAQVEAGSFATSYIPTSGATATRSLDVATIDIDNFGYNNQAASVLVEFSAYSWADRTDSGNFNRVWEFGGGGPSSNADGIFRDPAGIITDEVRYRFNEDDGTTAALGAANLDRVTGTHKVCVALGQDDAAICMDGGTVATGSGTAAMALYTGIDFGGDNNVTALGGHIKSFQYYPRRLTNAQLQELTS